MEKRTLKAGVLFAIAWVALVVLLLATARAAPKDQLDRDARLLAGICTHELTWNVLDDCEPIWRVLDARKRRLKLASLEEAIAGNCRRFYRGRSARPWARPLYATDALRTPKGWPDTWPPVTAFRERRAFVLEHARSIVRGKVPTRCEATPHRWGSRDPRLPDIDNAKRAIDSGRWREVDCGPTIQGYYELVAWHEPLEPLELGCGL